MSMTENAALTARRGSTWQLLAEFTLSREAGSERQVVEQAAAALQEMSLQPAQIEHIRQAVTEAVRRAARRAEEAQQDLPVHIYIWTSGVDDLRSYARKCGWGFFLVESQANEGLAPETQQVIELFLYQERKQV